jgi:hypothetical protein
MPDNRRVGSPKNNPGRMEPRSVSVQHDKPRVNDERKVRPHSSGNPTMGIRPSGGAQKPSGQFSDKLAGEYIQARDVPMDSIHEAGDVRVVHNKLLGGHYIVRGPHQTPISGKFNSREEALAHLRGNKGQQKPPAKMTEAELAEWNPFERFMQKPQAASQTPQGDDGVARKVNRLERQVDVLQRQLWQMGRDMAGKGSAAPATVPSPSPAPPERTSQFSRSAGPDVPIGARHEWQRRRQTLGAPKPQAAQSPTTRQTAPANTNPQGSNPDPQTNTKPRIRVKTSHEGGTSHQWQILKKLGYSDADLMQMSRDEMENAVRSRMPKTTRAAPRMAAEGYPDTSFEKCEPAHVSKIGDLGWKGRGKQPNHPGLNKSFIQARELRIEKVTEIASNDIDEMINKTMTRLGLEEAMHGGPEVDTVTLPAYWASALVNGDFSGLDEDEAAQCEMVMDKLANDGWEVVGTADDAEPHFTWNYQVHNPHSQYKGGEVMDYIVHRSQQPQTRQFDPSQQFESYTGSVSRGPQGAAPIAETNIPRARARWV